MHIKLQRRGCVVWCGVVYVNTTCNFLVSAASLCHHCGWSRQTLSLSGCLWTAGMNSTHSNTAKCLRVKFLFKPASASKAVYCISTDCWRYFILNALVCLIVAQWGRHGSLVSIIDYTSQQLLSARVRTHTHTQPALWEIQRIQIECAAHYAERILY